MKFPIRTYGENTDSKMSNHCYYTIDNVRKTRVYNPIHAAWQALFPSFPFGRVIDFTAPLRPITWITTSFIDCNILHGHTVGKKNISTLYDRFSISYVDREFKTGVFRRERKNALANEDLRNGLQKPYDCVDRT